MPFEPTMPTGPVRCLVLLKKKPGMTREEFDNYWLDVHGPIAEHYPHVLRYSQLHILESRNDTGARTDFEVDGIVDFVFDDISNIPKVWTSPEGTVGREDAKEFLGQVLEVFVQEFNIVDKLNSD